MAQVNPTTSIGALVAESPARAELFERLRLDYCCGGAQTLAEACAERGLDPGTVGELLAALDDEHLSGDTIERQDWQRASVDELCEHIVAVHHEGLRRELPRIAELLATVSRVHGRGHPELRDLERLFAGMRAALEPHLELEERVLFPACRELEAQQDASAMLDRDVLALLEDEHADTGEALAKLRKQAHDYDLRQALCGTHRALLEALRQLELDVHQHIHEENNVLFPRVRALAGAADAHGPDAPVQATPATQRERSSDAPGVGALPLCCQAWAAEQARPWEHVGGGASAA